MKRLISLVLAFVMVVSMVPRGSAVALHEENVVGSAFGESLTWELDLTTGQMVIGGEGDMPNCDSAPWENYKNEIKSVMISDTVTSIGEYAFSYCMALTNVDMGEGVTKIGVCAFDECMDLKEVIIPDSVIVIGRSAFNFCADMEYLSIGNGVKIIGEDAFSQCYGLTSLEIPDSVVTIETRAFIHCNGIENLTIGNSVATIGDGAFGGASALKEVWIPANVTYIGSGAFGSCESLTGIYVAEDNEFYSSDDRGVLFNKDKTMLIQAPGSLEGAYAIPDSVIEISHSAFEWCTKLVEVEMTDSVETIGSSAFDYCTSLTEVKLSKNIKQIPFNLFYGCHNLRAVSIPEGVTSIDLYAFLHCHALQEVTIPAGVESIYLGSFAYCYSLERITFLNPDCVIEGDEEDLEATDRVSFCGYRFSTAEVLAEELGVPYVPLVDCENGWHDPIESDVKQATCTEDGSSSCYCTLCNATYIRTIPAIGHDYWVTDMCVGYNVYTCQNCDHSHQEDVTVPIREGESIDTEPVCAYTVKYFTFVPEYSHTYSFTATAEWSVYICLYDEDRNCIASDDNPDWDKEQVQVSYALEAGKVYYIAAGVHYWNRYQVITVSAEAQHEYTDTVVVEGSCTVKEQVLRQCDCGYSYVEVRDYVHELVDQVCTLCGCDTNVTVNHTLNLASDISANLLVKKELLEGYDMDTVYMESTLEIYDGAKKKAARVIRTVPVDKGDYYYFTIEGLTAVNMNDRLTSVLHGVKDGRDCYSPMDDYSIADYAYKQLNNPNIPWELKTLCADLLRYGAKAQIYKGYRTHDLADGAMTAAHKEYLSYTEDMTFGNHNVVLEDCAEPTVFWVGKALNLESKVNLKFVFNPKGYDGAPTDLTARVSYEGVDGEIKTLTLEEAELYYSELGYYSFTLDTLLASELRTVVSVQIYAGETPVSCTLQYSADTYGNNKTGDMLELCKALFAYSDSAKSFFTN